MYLDKTDDLCLHTTCSPISLLQKIYFFFHLIKKSSGTKNTTNRCFLKCFDECSHGNPLDFIGHVVFIVAPLPENNQEANAEEDEEDEA